MPGGQLKRPGPPLGEHSVIQHTPSPSLQPSSRPAAEDCPSPSKRKKSSYQVEHESHKDWQLLTSVLDFQCCVLSFLLVGSLSAKFYVPLPARVSHAALQRFPGPPMLSQHSSAHPLHPKPAFWNPLHKNNSAPWQTSDRKNLPLPEFRVQPVRNLFIRIRSI